MNKFLIFLLLFTWACFGDTPASSTVKAKTFSGDGVTSIGAVGDALKVSVSNPTSSTVNQGSAGLQGWLVSVINSTLAVTGPLTNTELRASAVPVSLAAAPLPSGAATSALQTTGNGFISSIDGKLSTTANGLKVDGSTVTQPVSAMALPLPSGAATSALQSSGNASLVSIDGKTPALVSGRIPVDGSGVVQPISGSLGRTWSLFFGTDSVDVSGSTVTVGNSSLAVTGPLTNAQLRATPVPITGSITTTNSASGITGSPVPAQATQVGGSDGTNLRALKVSSTGVLSVDGSATTQPVSGTVTANAGSGTFQTNITNSSIAVTGPLTDTELRASAVPISGSVSQSGTWNNRIQDTSGNGLTSTNLSGKQSLDINIAGGTVNVGSVTANPPTNIVVLGSITSDCPTGFGCAVSSYVMTATDGLSTMSYETHDTWVGELATDISYDSACVTSPSTVLWFQTASFDTNDNDSDYTNSFTEADNLHPWVLNVAGTQCARLRAIDYTSGTVAVTLDSGVGTSAVWSVSTGNAGNNAPDDGNPVKIGGVYNISPPTLSDGYRSDIQVDINGKLILSPLTAASTVSAVQSGAWTTGRTWALSSGTDSVAASQSGSWTVTANAGTNLNTSALALDTSVSALQVSQASTTSGQKGNLTLAAVTTSAPSYTTAQTSPLSLTTSGALRTDSSGTTQPISAGALPLPSGAATEATLSNIESGTVENEDTFSFTLSGQTHNFDCTNMSSLRLQLAGITTGTIHVEGTTDGTNFADIYGVNDSTLDGQITSTPSVDGGFKFDCGGFRTVKVTSLTTDTVNIRIIANPHATIITSILDTVSTTNIGLQEIGTPIANKANLIAGTDGTNVTVLKTSAGGVLEVNGSGSTQPVSGTFWQATQPISGTVTANIGTVGTLATESTLSTLNGKVPSNLTVTSTRLLVDGSGVTQPVSIAGTVAVSGPLTDTQLRLTPVPVSGTVATGGLTDTQLRASAVPVSLASTTITGSVAVTGPVTDTQLRATPLPVSGTVTANAGTNLNTSLLALESGGNLASTKTNTDNLNLAQASTTSGQKGNLVLAATTTAAPTYTTAQSNPLSLTTAGALRVDNSSVTQPVSGTVAATESGTWTVQQGATPTSIANAWPFKLTDGSGLLTAKISNTTPSAIDAALIVGLSPNSVLPLPTGAATETTLSALNTKVPSGLTVTSTRLLVDGSGVTQPVSGTVTANLGTIGGVATETSLAKLTQTQGSTTSGQSGPLIQGAVTTAAPTYTTAQTSPLSLNTAGALRINGAVQAQDGAGNALASFDLDNTGGTSFNLGISLRQLANGTPVETGNQTNPLYVQTKSPLTANAPTVTSVGVASASAVAANASRKGLILTNNSNAKIYLGFGATAVLGSGIALFPGAVFQMDETSFSTGAINAIAAAAASSMAIQEFQ